VAERIPLKLSFSIKLAAFQAGGSAEIKEIKSPNPEYRVLYFMFKTSIQITAR
jgi:hypothetical protein